jgi:hypothetical protein
MSRSVGDCGCVCRQFILWQIAFDIVGDKERIVSQLVIVFNTYPKIFAQLAEYRWRWFVLSSAKIKLASFVGLALMSSSVTVSIVTSIASRTYKCVRIMFDGFDKTEVLIM